MAGLALGLLNRDANARRASYALYNQKLRRGADVRPARDDARFRSTEEIAGAAAVSGNDDGRIGSTRDHERHRQSYEPDADGSRARVWQPAAAGLARNAADDGHQRDEHAARGVPPGGGAGW